MRFSLTYEGKLKSGSGGTSVAKHKHEIRKHFHPQLKLLWGTHELLSTYKVYGTYQEISERPLSRYFGFGPSGEGRMLKDVISEAEDFSQRGYRFVPLVCKKFHLQCALDFLFLREDPVGSFRGDLDNRLKTLIDALRMPIASELQKVGPPDDNEKPFFCLLEDDKFITSFSVKSDTLLSKGPDKNYVKLVIDVTIQPTYATDFNLGFG